MALNKDKLAFDILSVFQAMKNNYDKEGYDGDDELAKGLAKAFKDYGETGSITTADKGTVSAGSFVGSGSGSLKLSDSDSYSTLKSAFSKMKSDNKNDDYMAEQIKASLEDMYGASDIVETTVNGIITPPSPATPITVTGASGKGTIDIDFDSVESGLKSFFASMKNIEGKSEEQLNNMDKELSDEIADLIDTAVKKGIVSTNDEGEISGASGSGTIA